MIKPYRLINSLEMAGLNHHFNQVLQEWSEEYAQKSLTMTLSAPPEQYKLPKACPIFAEGELLALIDDDYLNRINNLLFGENHSCFNATSSELLLLLIQRLFKVDHCLLEPGHQPSPHWIYKGSTCLLLHLGSAQVHLSLIINPDWIYQNLTPICLGKNHLDSLDEALTKEVLNLNLESIPLSLPINQLINMQIGDVITTDHPLTTPLRLMQNEQLIAQVDLGQSSPYKSIMIKRSS